MYPRQANDRRSRGPPNAKKVAVHIISPLGQDKILGIYHQAILPIKAGEEIFIDYGADYFLSLIQISEPTRPY